MFKTTNFFQKASLMFQRLVYFKIHKNISQEYKSGVWTPFLRYNLFDDIDYYMELSQKVLTLIFNIHIIIIKIDYSNIKTRL